VKPDVKPPAMVVGDTLTGASGGRDVVSTMWDLFWRNLMQLKLMTWEEWDEILAAQMEILAEKGVSAS
jgi:hypothetical protein